MRKSFLFPAAIAVLTGISLASPASAAVTIDWVTVGNAGNAPDTTGYGAVDYEYKISRNEVTIAQYAEFLNAVAAANDPYGLYNTSMASSTFLGSLITRSGSPGGYTYSVVGSGERPITYVSWFDAARFVNWLHNGQGIGGTETGVYNLVGAMSGTGFSVQPGAAVWIPSEDEWYKAAYYDPEKVNADLSVGGYWLYPTRSDSLAGNTLGEAYSANYIDGDYARDQNGLPSYLTDVGAYGPDSASYYGTNDQGGNVWEWNDAVISDSMRGMRGGSWNNSEGSLRSSNRNNPAPTYESNNVGFRVASVPEPGFVVLTVLFGMFGVARRRR